MIPNYGSVISAIPPILAGLAQSPTKALLVLIVYLIVNQIEGNLILPLIMARTVEMHPSVVSLGLLVMAALFGLIGVLIAIPLLSLAVDSRRGAVDRTPGGARRSGTSHGC